jgi:anti-sigma regulatory factor (Ser/Thr protein kinase)
MSQEQSFEGEPVSAGAARRFVASELSDVDPRILESIVLMVSELAANSIRHAQTPFLVVVDRSADSVRIDVQDEGAGRPLMRSPGPHEPSGRGLRIVDALSDDWGFVEHDRGGKSVWFTVSLMPSPEAVGGIKRRPRQRSSH